MKNTELLAAAIIKEAINDYRLAYRKNYKLIKEEDIQINLDQVTHFFRSEWFRELTDIDSDYLIECLQKERIEWIKEKESKMKSKLKSKTTEKTIKIKYHKDILEIESYEFGDWIDLRAAEYVKMKKGDLKYISLGVSMELPAGYEAYIAPRSSTPKNFGIICANSIGIIDNSFCGDNDVWKFCAYAIRDTVIQKGDRICQFRIAKNQDTIKFKKVDTLGNPDRGGYGSTGIK